MGIRQILDNPNGGQVLSGLVVLISGVAGMGVCVYGAVHMLLQGKLNEITWSDTQFAVLCGMVIAGAVGFLKSRLSKGER